MLYDLRQGTVVYSFKRTAFRPATEDMGQPRPKRRREEAETEPGT